MPNMKSPPNQKKHKKERKKKGTSNAAIGKALSKFLENNCFTCGDNRDQALNKKRQNLWTDLKKRDQELANYNQYLADLPALALRTTPVCITCYTSYRGEVCHGCTMFHAHVPCVDFPLLTGDPQGQNVVTAFTTYTGSAGLFQEEKWHCQMCVEKLGSKIGRCKICKYRFLQEYGRYVPKQRSQVGPPSSKRRDISGFYCFNDAPQCYNCKDQLSFFHEDEKRCDKCSPSWNPLRGHLCAACLMSTESLRFSLGGSTATCIHCVEEYITVMEEKQEEVYEDEEVKPSEKVKNPRLLAQEWLFNYVVQIHLMTTAVLDDSDSSNIVLLYLGLERHLSNKTKLKKGCAMASSSSCVALSVMSDWVCRSPL